jgi:hypothetical protein
MLLFVCNHKKEFFHFQQKNFFMKNEISTRFLKYKMNLKNDKFSIAMSMKRYSNHVIFYPWIHNTRSISNLCSFATDESLSKQLIELIALICKRCFESGKNADGECVH